jgi:hypothetical protein
MALVVTGIGTSAALFGYSVEIWSDGSTVVVGATEENGRTGAIYIFKKNATSGEWTVVKRIAGTVANKYYGSGVGFSSSADRVLVGSMSYGNTNQGTVFSITDGLS